MKGTLERLAPKLIPAPLRPSLAKVYHPLARWIVASKYRRKYRRRFVSNIQGNDEIMQFALDFMSEKAALRYYHAVGMYLQGGEGNVDDVERVLGDAGFSLRQAESFLEFACGYGRLTRHFVCRMSPSKITVSDIDHEGVDFVKKEFGVNGFYSVTAADELLHSQTYDVIVVVSLFSHLSPYDWVPWLHRLYEMLNAGGFLFFSTLGMHAYGAIGESEREARGFEEKADGFFYSEENETRGRLAGDRYGAAYVTEDYVERVVSSSSAGRLVNFSPAALNNFQDAYVIQRPS